MPDFFSNLLGRTFRRDAVLQRRRPSLFEPMTPPEGPLELPPVEETHGSVGRPVAPAELEITRETAERAPAAPRRRRKPAPVTSVVDERDEAASDESLTTHPSRRAPDHAPNGETLHTKVRRAPDAPLAPATTTVVHHETRHTDVTRVVERIIPPQPSYLPKSEPDVRVPGQDRLLHTAPGPMAASVAVVPPRDRPPAESAPPSIDQLRPAPPPALLAAPLPTRKSSRGVAPAVVPPPPLPTIQVTIGRVEIRAIQQAAAPRVTRPATPRLSLEEYLRARSGGGR